MSSPEKMSFFSISRRIFFLVALVGIKAQQVIDRVYAQLDRQKKTVLIADDDSTIGNLIRHKMRALGYRVVIAEEGQKALDLMKMRTFSLVLLDRMMPGMDGLSVLQKMKQDPRLKGVPVIFLTAKKTEMEILEGLSMGVVDYIIKPFNLNEVISRCRRILDAKKKA